MERERREERERDGERETDRERERENKSPHPVMSRAKPVTPLTTRALRPGLCK